MPELAKIIYVGFSSSLLSAISEDLAKKSISLKGITIESFNQRAQIIQTEKPKLIVIEEQAQGVDISSVITACKEDFESIPIIALVQESNIALAVSCMKSGASNVIPKSNSAQIKLAILEELSKSKPVHERSKRKPFEHINARCILNYHKNGNVTTEFMNQDFLDLVSYNQPEKDEKVDLSNLVHPDDLQSYNTFIEKVKKRTKPLSHEMRLVLKHANPIWVRETDTVLEKQNGSLRIEKVLENIHTHGIAFAEKGVDKFKHASKETRVDEFSLHKEKLRLLFEESPVSGIVIDSSLQVITTNSKFKNLLSLTGNDVERLHCNDFLPPDDYEKFSLALKSLNKKSEHQKIEIRLLSKTGDSIWVKATLGFIIKNPKKPLVYFAQFLNISEQKSLMHSLKLQNLRLEALAEVSRVFIDCYDFSASLNNALKILSNVIGTDRAYLLSRKSNKSNPNEPLTLLVDYTATGVKSYKSFMLSNPESIKEQASRFMKAFNGIMKQLKNGQHFQMIARLLKEDQRAIYEYFHVKSCIVFPLMVHDEFYGLIGFDDCTSERAWEEHDINLLQTASSTIGNAFGRYLALNDLKESRTQYETLSKNYPNGAICLFDKSHRVLLLHAKDLIEDFPEILTYEGKLVEEILPEAHAKIINNAIDETFDGKEQHFEYEIADRCWLIQTVPNVSSAQTIETITFIAQNITPQKKEAQAIIESKKDYQSIFEYAHDAIFVYDTAFKTIIDANFQACNNYGYTKDELKSLPPSLICKYPARGNFHIKETLEKGFLTGYENVHLHKDGREIFVEINSSIIEYGGQKAILSICHDVTGRNEIEHALRESQRKYRQIIENTGEGIWILDHNAKTVYVNPQLASMLGFTADSMRDTSFFDYIYPEDMDIGKRMFMKNNPGQFKRVDLKLVRQDGYFLWAILSPTLIYDEDNRSSGIHILVTDITTRKALEDTLRESEERYKTLAENFPHAAALIIDQNMRCVLAAGDAFKKLGADRPNTEGKTLSNVHPKELALFFEEQYKASFKGERRSFQTFYQNRHWLVHTIPNKSSDGKINTISVICHDVTELKKQNESFLEHKLKFDHLFNRALIGLMIIDSNGKISKVNPKLCSMLGYDNQELVGKTVLSISAKEDADTESKLIQNLFDQSQQNYEMSKRFIHKTSNFIWVKVHASILSDDHLKPAQPQCFMMIESSDDINHSY